MVEETIQQLADAGLFSHLSIYAKWGTHNTPTIYHATMVTIWGQGHGEDENPLQAIEIAVSNAPKTKPTKVQPSAEKQVPIGNKVTERAALVTKIPVTPQTVEPVTKPKSLMEWLKP